MSIAHEPPAPCLCWKVIHGVIENWEYNCACTVVLCGKKSASHKYGGIESGWDVNSKYVRLCERWITSITMKAKSSMAGKMSKTQLEPEVKTDDTLGHHQDRIIALLTENIGGPPRRCPGSQKSKESFWVQSNFQRSWDWNLIQTGGLQKCSLSASPLCSGRAVACIVKNAQNFSMLILWPRIDENLISDLHFKHLKDPFQHRYLPVRTTVYVIGQKPV